MYFACSNGRLYLVLSEKSSPRVVSVGNFEAQIRCSAARSISRKVAAGAE